MGIDNCSGVWFKGLRAPWTTSFNNNFSLSKLKKNPHIFTKKGLPNMVSIQEYYYLVQVK